jgi:hypothetical protein
MVVWLGDDHPGALLELLQEFAVRGVNLMRIESRPTGQGPSATEPPRATDQKMRLCRARSTGN